MIFLNLFFSFFVALEAILLLDAAIICKNKILPLKFCLLFYLLFFGAVFCANFFLPVYLIFGILQTVLLAAFCILAVCWGIYQRKAAYSKKCSPGCPFQNQTIMVIVPHQDDELNLIGTELYRQLARKHNRVITVFVTNGDYLNKGSVRIKEAIKVNHKLGVKKEDVIFLGYGGGWSEDAPNIYNAAGKGTLTSHCQKIKTYGIKNHPAFHDGVDYTTENFFEDFKNVILSNKPDVIFCSDYDCQEDHVLTTLAFEKVMGNLLKENRDYTPRVFKGFCYPTAWTAPDDFYRLPFASTADIKESKTGIFRQYDWENRIRLPLEGLSRSLWGCPTFSALKRYQSQQAFIKAPHIINGDKVFWERRTDSALKFAKITVSSGNAAFLNDFMLFDCNDVKGALSTPYDEVWVPDATDAEKTITIEFPRKINLYNIRLYGNIRPDSKIRNAKICLDNGKEFDTGEIQSCGTDLQINEREIQKLTVSLSDTVGDHAGLGEIEIFETQPAESQGFIKLCNESGDFLYDVVTDSNVYKMQLYLYHVDLPLDDRNYIISSGNKRVRCRIEKGKVVVETAAKEKTFLTIQSRGGKFSDTIRFCRATPKKIERLKKLLNREHTLFRYYKGVKFNHLLLRGREIIFSLFKSQSSEDENEPSKAGPEQHYQGGANQ